MKRSPIIAGVDTGGTFTDFIFVNGTTVHVDKRPSRPADPVGVIREGVVDYLKNLEPAGAGERTAERIIEEFAERLVIIHGTTVPTNALLEGKTAKACLITNKGFEDVIEIGRQERLDLFHLPARKADAPVARNLRFGVDQRTLHTGKEHVALTNAAIKDVVERVKKSGARTAAVCLLYSFLRPGPEERLGKALRRAGLAVSISSRVAPEFREYERTTTTVINAALIPVMDAYLKKLNHAFRGVEILVMCSTGGVAPPVEAAERPVATILSGPAGGAAGAAALLKSAARQPKTGRRAGRKTRRDFSRGQAITFDMGGTSTDVALIDGEPLRRHQSSILGLPLLTPSVDIHTVGAGGGSKIWIDRGGALRVGPESTGADPGPACYGRAFLPALTDAHIALGRLDSNGLLGGGFHVDADRSARALGPLARRLKVTPAALCDGVLDVADAVVEKAIRVITLGRGRDPRDFPLLAFGGAGGLHACRLMRSMGLPAVIVPSDPGVLSAAGIAGADLSEERSRGFPLPLEGGFVDRLKALYDRLEADWRKERQASGRVKRIKEVDLRYLGQSFQLTLPFDNGRGLIRRFHETHLEQYGHNDHEGRIEAVTARIRFVRQRGDLGAAIFAARLPGSGRRTRPKPSGEIRPVKGFGRRHWALYRRSALRPGDLVGGPAVITEFSATTVVEEGCTLEVAEGMMVIFPD